MKPLELLIVDAMAPFDLAVLLRPTRLDVAVTDSSGFDRQFAGEGNSVPLSHCNFLMANGNARRGSPKKSRLECWLRRR